MEGGTSGSRRTRSQVAPDWTVKDCLILVNEVAAVEADCSNALSSFQKWEIISENCNALDVHRTLNQCRRKWDTLLSGYKLIKQWESQAGDGCSYWSLSSESRKRLELPGIFENGLYEAIDAVVMVQEDKAGTEPDSDPDAQEDVNKLDAIAEPGPKRSRPRAMALEEKLSRKARKEVAARKKPERRSNQTQEKDREQQRMELQSENEEEKTIESCTEGVKSIEEEAEAMAAKLGEKAELIHAIVAGNHPSEDGETGDGGGNELRMKLVRRQGDELISCLGEIVDTLHRFRGLAQGFE
ncbi:PREDICTED: trihelix transcription factor ASR3 isoform X2 [Tarenaya hassleriana]|uniref:trihelix transcription factor ASR3 isoform X2 n=1 Tax=Tarenaya hassleriana TaxID=28532 RepID=UPI00053C22EB|nr:PREDICTED: trihelix transcription factor ASR3 isoform X2 [Tarenaya hassleriana]